MRDPCLDHGYVTHTVDDGTLGTIDAGRRCAAWHMFDVCKTRVWDSAQLGADPPKEMHRKMQILESIQDA